MPEDPATTEPQAGPTPEELARLERIEALVPEWVTVPDIVERTRKPLTLVRAWLKDRELIGIRRGERNVVSVPAAFIDEHGITPHLSGTLTVLLDARFSEAEVIEWLFTPDDTLRTGSPMSDLLAGHKTEIRRRAQELAL